MHKHEVVFEMNNPYMYCFFLQSGIFMFSYSALDSKTCMKE
jgi:hypothetical protein